MTSSYIINLSIKHILILINFPCLLKLIYEKEKREMLPQIFSLDFFNFSYVFPHKFSNNLFNFILQKKNCLEI